jgi:alcohol dehydrogenase class IV
VSGDFTWRDAGRTVVFRHEGVADAPQLLDEHGFAPFELLSTPRALAAATDLAAKATAVHNVPLGSVPGLAATLLASVHGGRWASGVQIADVSGPSAAGALVAFGGGRVIDVAKAVASVSGARVVAIPTTMSGAEMTGIHRLPAGAESRVASLVRPALVIADPDAMTGQPEAQLRASSMNALAHGADSLYTPFANPVSKMTALRGAELIAGALDEDPAGRDRAALALGSILCGYAIDSGMFALHHVICQTLVRVCGSPHAETNAAILPHAATFLAGRAPAEMSKLATAVDTDVDGLEPRLLELGGRPAGLGAAGADRSQLDQAVEAMLQRPELAFVPGPALAKADLAELLDRAW